MKETLKLALDALNWSTPHDGAVITHGEAIAAIKAALAQDETSSSVAAQQEPVAFESLLGAIARGWCHEKNANKEMDSDLAIVIAAEVKAIYTTPPQRQPEQELYSELLFAVGEKYPNETRHQTALRYIRQAEICAVEQSKAAHNIKETTE